MTMSETKKYIKFILNTLPTLLKPTDTILDDLNLQIGGMKENSSSEHLIVVKTWMKTNEVGETTCIFEAFDMEKFFDKEWLIDTLHTMYKQGKI